ncbi:hypothetical protein G6O67_003057 [Ophiocordyceps sinensis]|uniref:Uncharacterized protein n=1 Tax=Ophiocordyceps sinensis TaxID=72228 RepID=A0A8H4PVG3_9HYPO|nr:hypothetical protein G6O67_003057 [Ophiocordyceps sinensis]
MSPHVRLSLMFQPSTAIKHRYTPSNPVSSRRPFHRRGALFTMAGLAHRPDDEPAGPAHQYHHRPRQPQQPPSPHPRDEFDEKQSEPSLDTFNSQATANDCCHVRQADLLPKVRRWSA